MRQATNVILNVSCDRRRALDVLTSLPHVAGKASFAFVVMHFVRTRHWSSELEVDVQGLCAANSNVSRLDPVNRTVVQCQSVSLRWFVEELTYTTDERHQEARVVNH